MIKRKGPLEALRKIDRAKINSCFRRSGRNAEQALMCQHHDQAMAYNKQKQSAPTLNI